MPRPFWNSPGPIFLDRPATIEELKQMAARAAVRDPRIERVVLFGSLATGRATPRSDADLLIVLSEHPEPLWFNRIPEYLEALPHAPVPIDVFPYLSREVQDRREADDPFLIRIETEGIEIFRRV